MNKNDNKYAKKIVNAFLKNKIISPLPTKYTKKLSNAQNFRKLCESKSNSHMSHDFLFSKCSSIFLFRGKKREAAAAKERHC